MNNSERSETVKPNQTLYVPEDLYNSIVIILGYKPDNLFIDKNIPEGKARFAEPIQLPIAEPILAPIKRETMTVQSYGRLIEVDKEDWMNQFNARANKNEKGNFNEKLYTR